MIHCRTHALDKTQPAAPPSRVERVQKDETRAPRSLRIRTAISIVSLLACVLNAHADQSAIVPADQSGEVRQDSDPFFQSIKSLTTSGAVVADIDRLVIEIEAERAKARSNGRFGDWLSQRALERLERSIDPTPRTLTPSASGCLGVTLGEVYRILFKGNRLAGCGDSAAIVFAAIDHFSQRVHAELSGTTIDESTQASLLCAEMERVFVALPDDPPWGPSSTNQDVQRSVSSACTRSRELLASKTQGRSESDSAQIERTVQLSTVLREFGLELMKIRGASTARFHSLPTDDLGARRALGRGHALELTDVMTRVYKQPLIIGFDELSGEQMPGFPARDLLEFAETQSAACARLAIALLGSIVMGATDVAINGEADAGSTFVRNVECVWSVFGRNRLACDATIARVGSRVGVVFGPTTVRCDVETGVFPLGSAYAMELLTGATITWSLLDGDIEIRPLDPVNGWISGGRTQFDGWAIFDAAPSWILEHARVARLLQSCASAQNSLNFDLVPSQAASFSMKFDMRDLKKTGVGTFERVIHFNAFESPSLQRVTPGSDALASAALGEHCRFSMYAAAQSATQLPSSPAGASLEATLLDTPIARLMASLHEAESGSMSLSAIAEASEQCAQHGQHLFAFLFDEIERTQACAGADPTAHSSATAKSYRHLNLPLDNQFRRMFDRHLGGALNQKCQAFTVQRNWCCNPPPQFWHRRLHDSVPPVSRQKIPQQ